jgi:hypothetical protein
MRETLYDRAAATAYAREWALGRNPAYYNFDDLGGDCTNFASQCLYAGAGIMNDTPTFGWYYRTLNDRSPSWTSVEYLYDFLINNQGRGPYASQVTEDAIRPGDLIQLGRTDGSYYHTLVVLVTAPSILIAAHSNDALNRPLISYRYDRARFLHIEGVRLW